MNTGYGNFGEQNHGNLNHGNLNVGSYNRGNYNEGNYNFGSCNQTNGAIGFFNTKPTEIMLFNKPSGMTAEEFQKSKWFLLLKRLQQHSGNYEAWWSSLSIEEQEVIKSMPNFNKRMFSNITGIVPAEI